MVNLRLTGLHLKNLQYLIRTKSTSSIQKKYSYYHHIGKDPLVYRTIGQQLELSARNFGDREAIVTCHEQKRYTFNEILKISDQLAASFSKIGLNHGDRIGIWSPNYSFWYITMMAAARAGLVLVGINPAFQAPEVEYCINKVGIKAIVAPESFRTQNYYEIIEKIIPDLKSFKPGKIKSKHAPTLHSVIINTSNRLPGAFQFDEILNYSNKDDVIKIKKEQDLIQPDSPCNIQFTSGTTGSPKATLLTHYNFVNNGIHIGNRTELNTKQHRICVQVPLFHAYGVTISSVASMAHGSTLCFPDATFNPAKSLETIINEKCTMIHGTPTMYVDLIAKQKELKLPIKTAEIAVTGGAPCSPQLFRDIKNILGLRRVTTVFGLTETTAVIFQSLLDESDDHVLNTVGFIQDHIEAKVVDGNGNIVPFGERGELCIRGYLTSLGYFGDEEKTKELIGADKWLRTGDQFVLQEDGYGRIVGRLKEMIIRGGENIFPKEIEDFLNTHPDIKENHVIGVPDERMGEEMCAFIRLNSNKNNITQEQIKEFSKGKIAHFKIPRYIRVVNDFPKTVSGKIQKFKLKEIFDAGNN